MWTATDGGWAGRSIGLGVWICVFLWIGCASPEETENIPLGLIVEQDTVDGPSVVRAVQLAVDQFNAAGGLEVDGERRSVVLHVEDPMGKPEEAARVALRLINQAGVVALVGPVRSVNAIPVAEVADKAHIPMVSPGSTHVSTTLDKPFAFRVNYTDPVQGVGLARFARETLDASTAAVIFDQSNVYSRDLAQVFRTAFEQGGGELGVFAGYVNDEWTDALEPIQRYGPDILFLPDFDPTDLPVIAQRARDVGVTATFLGSDSWPYKEYSRVEVFDGAYQSVPWHWSASNPRTVEFLEAYQRAWDGDSPDQISPVLAYDAIGVILEALRRAGRPDPDAVREALATLEDYPGVTGPITFRGTDGDPTVQGVILTLENGQARFVQRLPVAGSDSKPGAVGRRHAGDRYVR